VLSDGWSLFIMWHRWLVLIYHVTSDGWSLFIMCHRMVDPYLEYTEPVNWHEKVFFISFTRNTISFKRIIVSFKRIRIIISIKQIIISYQFTGSVGIRLTWYMISVSREVIENVIYCYLLFGLFCQPLEFKVFVFYFIAKYS
jgi:hypothetical protein